MPLASLKTGSYELPRIEKKSKLAIDIAQVKNCIASPVPLHCHRLPHEAPPFSSTIGAVFPLSTSQPSPSTFFSLIMYSAYPIGLFAIIAPPQRHHRLVEVNSKNHKAENSLVNKPSGTFRTIWLSLFLQLHSCYLIQDTSHSGPSQSWLSSSINFSLVSTLLLSNPYKHCSATLYALTQASLASSYS
jgi:hypothetical protein